MPTYETKQLSACIWELGRDKYCLCELHFKSKMAKWKPLTLSSDLLAKGEGELLGIEELECPDESLIIRGKLKKKRKHEGTISPNKLEVKKKKKKTSKVAKKTTTETFEGFNHHDKMLSWNGFGLREEILASLYNKKFFEPTEIQLKCLGPAICGRRDILGAAETGSGKTLAFGIPIINGILQLKEKESDGGNEVSEESEVSEDDWENDENDIGCVKVKNLRTETNKNRLIALILTPTRELAVQVKDHLTDICKYTNIRIVLVVGGLAHEKQERLLKARPEIIVATPGRLWDLIQSRNVHLQDVSKIRYLAIDETDRMLEKGHFEELNNLFEYINANVKEKEKRQNFVFSATLTLVHEPPSYLKGESRQRITPGQKLQQLINRVGITNPKIVDITSEQITPENLKEFKVICKFEEKDYYLHYFLENNKGKTIIFCNSIGCVKRLANLLNILDWSPLPLHANMVQKQRLKNLEKFREKENSILIATDVAARGLDILNVHHVLHYQVPKTAETYIHRSGRTARRQNTGNVLLLIEPEEYKSYLKLTHTLGRSHEIEDLPIENSTLSHMKKVIHLARDVDQLMLAIKKQTVSKNWFVKAQEEMDMIIDDDDIPKQISDEGYSRMKTDLNVKRKKLKALLRKPEASQKFGEKVAKPSHGKLLHKNKAIAKMQRAGKANKKLKKTGNKIKKAVK